MYAEVVLDVDPAVLDLLRLIGWDLRQGLVENRCQLRPVFAHRHRHLELILGIAGEPEWAVEMSAQIVIGRGQIGKYGSDLAFFRRPHHGFDGAKTPQCHLRIVPPHHLFGDIILEYAQSLLLQIFKAVDLLGIVTGKQHSGELGQRPGKQHMFLTLAGRRSQTQHVHLGILQRPDILVPAEFIADIEHQRQEAIYLVEKVGHHALMYALQAEKVHRRRIRCNPDIHHLMLLQKLQFFRAQTGNKFVHVQIRDQVFQSKIQRHDPGVSGHGDLGKVGIEVADIKQLPVTIEVFAINGDQVEILIERLPGQIHAAQMIRQHHQGKGTLKLHPANACVDSASAHRLGNIGIPIAGTQQQPLFLSLFGNCQCHHRIHGQYRVQALLLQRLLQCSLGISGAPLGVFHR